MKANIGIGVSIAAVVALLAFKKRRKMSNNNNTTGANRDEFMKYVRVIIDYEGGYTNHPTDRGGETKYGITKKDYPNLDIANLTIPQAVEIYYADYWQKGRANMVASHLRFFYFDTCVNMGIGGAVRTMQRAAKVKVDAILGPVTSAASKNLSLETYKNYRYARYKAIVDRDATQKVFWEGWMNRLNKAYSQQLKFTP